MGAAAVAQLSLLFAPPTNARSVENRQCFVLKSQFNATVPCTKPHRVAKHHRIATRDPQYSCCVGLHNAQAVEIKA